MFITDAHSDPLLPASCALEWWHWICIQGDDSNSLPYMHQPKIFRLVSIFLCLLIYLNCLFSRVTRNFSTFIQLKTDCLQILRCGPPAMNKAMATHFNALGYTLRMQFQFFFFFFFFNFFYLFIILTPSKHLKLSLKNNFTNNKKNW